MMWVQETKLESIDKLVVQNIWAGNNIEFVNSSSVGASGGLLILWKKDFFRATNIIVQRSYILLQGVLYDNFPCILVNVYAPNDVGSRKVLWDELVGLKANFQEPWCIGGDFNEIKDVGERVGCLRMDRGMKDFIEFCNSMEFIDLPMLGRKYTWSNYQNQAIHSRLDRFLCSQDWIMRFKIL